MNDPHVEELCYRFISENSSDRFEEAAPLITTLGTFEIELKDSVLTVRPQEHYAEVDKAKEDFEPHLKSWESSAFLDSSRFRIRFAFMDARLADRDPAPDETTLSVKVAEMVMIAERVALVRDMKTYPCPASSFRADPPTEELIYRLKKYRDGRESLPVVAYYVLEKLEVAFVGKNQKNVRQELGRQLRVDNDILKRLGELSNIPDPRIGRHAAQGDAQITPEELHWMEAVTFRLARRVGEIHAAIPHLPQITMGDFPPIP